MSISNYSPPNAPPGSAGNEDAVVNNHRLGLIPDQGRDRLNLGDFLTQAAFSFSVPDADDHIAGVPAWNLGSNNAYGTCGPTALANYITMCYWNLLGVQVVVEDDSIFNLYRASGNEGFPPSPDNGVDLNYMLNQSLRVGLEITYTGVTRPGYYPHQDVAAPLAGAKELVKPVAFAALSATSPSELRAGTAVLGGLELGVSLQVAQQAQSTVWDVSPSGLWGGHAIMGAAYTGASSGADVEVITWAKEVGMTDAFVLNQLTQAYGIILPVHLTHPNFLQGVDVGAFASAYQELTGRSFPARP